MDNSQLKADNSNNPDVLASVKAVPTTASPSVAQYSSAQATYPIEDLEVHERGATTERAQLSAHRVNTNLLAFSRRKAMVVSIAIALAVTLFTGASILILARKAPKSQQLDQSLIQTQDVTLKDAEIKDLPAELQGANSSLLVNGNLVTRGELKFSNSNYLTVVKLDNITSDQTYTLPNSSGVFCLSSNNCNFVTSDTIETTNVTLSDLQSQINQPPAVLPASSLINNINGAVLLQGTTNQVSVTTSGGTITLSAPQDLAQLSSPTFAGLNINGNMAITGTLTLPLDCTTYLNGGSLSTDASGNVICQNDESSGAGASVTTPGGTSGTIPMFTSGDVIADSIMSQALGTITIAGNLLTSGALDVTGNITQTGVSTFSTGTGSISLNGNTTISGANTFTTGTGAVSLNGATTVASNQQFSAYGPALFRDATNGTNVFQIQNAANTSVLNVSTSYDTYTNLVSNNTFESDTPGVDPVGWLPITGTGGVGTPDIDTESNPSFVRTGSRSMRVTTTTNANDGVRIPVTTAVNSAYVLTMWVRTSTGTVSDIVLGHQILGGFFTLDCTISKTVNTNWTQFICSFTTNPTFVSDHIYLRRSNSQNAAGITFYIDDVRLHQTVGNKIQIGQIGTTGTGALGQLQFAYDGGGNIAIQPIIGSGNTGNYILTLPAESGIICTTSNSSPCATGADGRYLSKITQDTATVAVPVGEYLYTFNNSSSGVASTVLYLENNTNTSETLRVRNTVDSTANPDALLINVLNASARRLRVYASGRIGVNLGSTVNPSTDSTFGDLTFGGGSGVSRKINIAQSTTVNTSGGNLNLVGGAGNGTGTGGTTTLQGGDGGGVVAGSGNSNGGWVQIEAGAATGSGTGGRVNIGTINTPSQINIGTGATSGDINIGGTTQVGTILLGQSASTNTIRIGDMQGGSGNIVQTILIGTQNGQSSGNDSSVIRIGSVLQNSELHLRVGNSASANDFSVDGDPASIYSIGSSTSTGTITIGGLSQTGTLTVGQYTGTGTTTVNISAASATGNRQQTINIGTGDSNTGNGTDGGTRLVLGNDNTRSSTLIQGGNCVFGGGGFCNGNEAIKLQTDPLGEITIGGRDAHTGAISIGIGTGVQSLLFGTGGTGAKTVTVGSTASTGVTTIQAGGNVVLNSTSGTIQLQDSTNITGDLTFTNQATRTIKLADSTSPATVGAALNITGANGSGAAGGAINITGGNAVGAFTGGGGVTIMGGSGINGSSLGFVTVKGGVGGGVATLQGGDGGSASLDWPGGNTVVAGGQGTGTAAGGSINFRTAPAGGVSGTSLNALVARMQITSTGDILMDTDTFYLSAAGNTIGIGDTTPLYALTVGNGDLFGVNSTGQLLFEGATADANELTITVADPSADRTYTIPNSSALTDTFCLVTLGNCAGSGGGVTGSGTNNQIAKFTSTGSTVGDSTLSDNGANVTTSVDMIIQGGDLSLGTTTQAGSIIFHDATSNTATLSIASHGGDYVYTLPDAGGNDTVCLLTLGNCSGAGTGGASSSEAFITFGNTAGLANERAIAVNTTNLQANDGGANASYTINTVQDIATSSSPTFTGLALTGTLDVTGLTTLNGNLTVQNGDTFTFNSDAFTDLSGNGLQVSSGSLTLLTQANKGLEVDGGGLSLIDCALNEILKYNGSNQWACAADGAGTGITGSGTAGTLPVYTGTGTTVGDSIISQSTGNIGINDLTSDAALEVLSTTEQLRLTYTDGTVDSRFTVDSGGDLTINNSGTKTVVADDLQVTGNDILDSTGATRVTLGSSVNIATNLTTAGNVILGDASADRVTLTAQILGGSPLVFQGATDNGFETTIGVEDPTADVTYRFATATAGTYDVCTSVGNCVALVGNTLQQSYDNDSDNGVATIGLTTTDGSLVVSNPAVGGSVSAFALKVEQLNAGAVGGLLLSNAGTGYSLRVNDDGTDTDTTPFIITSTGNVGIGNDTPSALLTVGSGNLFQVQSTGHTRTIDGTAALPAYSFTGNGDLGIYRIGPDNLGLSTTGLERLRIDSNGDVGIGGASSGPELHVAGDIAFNDQLFFAGQAAPSYYIQYSSGFQIVQNSIQELFINPNTHFTGFGDGTPDAKVDIEHTFSPLATGTTNNLGLAVTTTNTINKTAGVDNSWGQLLTVTRTGATGGTINNYGLEVSVTGDTGGTSTNIGLEVTVSGADTNYAAIFQGGNVGRGDTNPTSLLSVGSGGLFQVNNFGAIAAVVGITTSADIIPSTADTIDLGSTTQEWDEIYLGDGGGLVLGADQDVSLAYDEATDDRVELTAPVDGAASLFIEDRLGLGVQMLTLTDDGTVNDTLIATTSYVRISIDETANGGIPDLTISEASAKDGDILIIVNNEQDASEDTFTITNSAGVVQLPGGATLTLGPNDAVTLIYMNDRWVTLSNSNN